MPDSTSLAGFQELGLVMVLEPVLVMVLEPVLVLGMVLVHPSWSYPGYTHPGYTTADRRHHAHGDTMPGCACPESEWSWGSEIGPHLSQTELEVNILSLTGYKLIESAVCCSLKKYDRIG